MNTLVENIKEYKIIASGLVVVLAGLVLAFASWPASSLVNAAQSEEEHAGESHHESGHGEGGHAQEVHLSAAQQQSLSIQTETLTDSSAASGITRPATITFNPDRVARIGPRVNAKVVRVLADLGDWVEKGEAVVVMSSMKLGAAKADYLTAKAHLETARATYEREQKLHQADISSEAELLEAKASFQEAKSERASAAEMLRLYGLSNSEIQDLSSGSGQPASRFVLRSPISGTVQQRKVSPGESVSRSETPIHVANAGQMWAMIDAYERDLPALEEGQDVVLRLRGLPGQSFRGQIDFISSRLNEETRTVRARAVIDNAGRALRSGMFGTAEIETGEAATYPMISVDAVQRVNGKHVVFVPGEKAGAFHATNVQIGAETESGLVAITSGLTAGDTVVTQGAFNLKSALTAGSRSAAHSH